MTIRPFNNKEERKTFDKEIRELMFGSVNEKIEELNNMVSKPIKIKRRKMKNKSMSQMIKEREKNKFTFKLLNLIKKCRGKGKFGLAIKLVNKYNLDKEKLAEAYYD